MSNVSSAPNIYDKLELSLSYAPIKELNFVLKDELLAAREESPVDLVSRMHEQPEAKFLKKMKENLGTDYDEAFLLDIYRHAFRVGKAPESPKRGTIEFTYKIMSTQAKHTFWLDLDWVASRIQEKYQVKPNMGKCKGYTSQNFAPVYTIETIERVWHDEPTRHDTAQFVLSTFLAANVTFLVVYIVALAVFASTLTTALVAGGVAGVAAGAAYAGYQTFFNQPEQHPEPEVEVAAQAPSDCKSVAEILEMQLKPQEVESNEVSLLG